MDHDRAELVDLGRFCVDVDIDLVPLMAAVMMWTFFSWFVSDFIIVSTPTLMISADVVLFIAVS